MPTAGRLIAAILLAGLGFYVSQLIKPLMPEGTQFGMFDFVNSGLGAIMGWKVTGGRLGYGIQTGIGAGLTGAAALVFWGLLLNSGAVMVEKSLDKAYDGPMEAVVDVFTLMIEHGQIMATFEIISTLVIGGVVIGVIAEMGARRWR